jgi:small subunit ribosomal protein S2
MPIVTMKSLLEAGVHFGHQTRRWNPKMKPYIFTERNGIYILDLQRTLRELDHSYKFARSVGQRGGAILFVGTKKQAQEPIITEAGRAGMPYVTNRWLGGMLTNFVTIRSRVQRMEELEAMEADGRMAALPKKEQILLRKELVKLQANLDGIRDMRELPQAVFVIDTKREDIAIKEARRLRIPIIGLVDTNADPDEVDYLIPANDDAIRSVGLMCRVIADALIDGRGGIQAPEIVASEAPVPVVVTAADEPAVEEAAVAVEAAPTEAAADEAKAASADEAKADDSVEVVEAPAAE